MVLQRPVTEIAKEFGVSDRAEFFRQIAKTEVPGSHPQEGHPSDLCATT